MAPHMVEAMLHIMAGLEEGESLQGFLTPYALAKYRKLEAEGMPLNHIAAEVKEDHEL